MYEAFYGLREKPFNLTPDPKFLYLSEKHKEAFAHLMFGIKNRSGFVMVTGEIGTGKTTICRTLLNQLDEETEVAFIFNPYLSPEELLLKINEDFGIHSQARSVKELIDELNDYLLDRNARGRNCVLVIDEAQNLTPGVLEQIRLLSNLETETTKLLQIVLIGQPELMQHLSLDELRQLNQRITARYHLRPLNRAETIQYIAYRLRVAGGRRRIHFTPGAVKLVYRYSGGTPRVINAICDRALLIGYTKEVKDITASIVRKAWAEVQGARPSAKKRPLVKRLIPSPAVVAIVALLAVTGKYAVDYASAQPGPWSEGEAGVTQWIARINPFADAATTPVEPPRREEVLPEVSVVPAVERPVRVETPPGADEFDPTFAGLIDRMDPETSRNAAVAAMLRAWNLALLTEYPADDSVESVRIFATESRLICEEMTLTLDQLEAINLPALVRLYGKSQAIWSAITRIEYDEYRITTSMSESALVPREALAECYLDEALVFWRDPMADAPILRPTSTGEDVRVLQVQLRALGRLNRKPSGTYDAATAQAVKKLQHETGLTDDGVLGPQTRMVLYSWLPGFATPALRSLPPLLLTFDDDEKEAPPKASKTVAKNAPRPAPPPPAAPEEKPETTIAAETTGPEDLVETPVADPAKPETATAAATGPADSVETPGAEPPETETVAEAAGPGEPVETTTKSGVTESAEPLQMPAEPAQNAEGVSPVTPEPAAVPPAFNPILQGPPDPFAPMPLEGAVSEEELAQPQTTPAPGQESETGRSVEATPTSESAEEGEERVKPLAPRTSDSAPTVTPPVTGGMPLVPSRANNARETDDR